MSNQPEKEDDLKEDEVLAAAEESPSTERESEVKPEIHPEIQALKQKVWDYEVKFTEARAFVRKLESEVEDIRRRSERDLEKNIDSKLTQVVSAILSPLDSLCYSLKAAETQKSKDPQFEAFINGIKLVESQMLAALNQLGVERIETEGAKFDPHLHEALINQSVESADMDGIILQEMKAGYRLKDKVIRPAQVAVGNHHAS